MTEQIKDPRTSFDVYGYIYNPITGLRESYLDALEFEINGNSFILENSLIDNEAIKALEYKEGKIIVNNRLPKIYLTFSSRDIRRSIPVSNNDNIIYQSLGRYELERCIINTLEFKIMPGKRYLCIKAEGTFDFIKYYEEDYNDFIDKQYYN